MEIEVERARFRLREERWELRARIGADPGDVETRRLLAESYRATGHLDQAGRWGLLVPGWTTAEERQLFARMVTRTGSPTAARVRRLLLLPTGSSIADHDPEGLYAGFPELLERELAEPEGESGTRWFAAAMVFLVVTIICLFLSGPVLAFVSILPVDEGVLRAVIRVASYVVGLAFVMELICHGIDFAIVRHRRRIGTR